MNPATRRHALFTLAAAAAALALPFLARGADGPAGGALAAAPITHGLRLFSCGHSFHFQVPGLLEELAKAGGFADQVYVGKSMIGGSKSIQHWAVKDEKNEAKRALEAGSVDVLTLTPIYLPDDGIEYAAIYRKSPAGLPAPALFAQLHITPEEREKLAWLLQEIAWDAVTHHPLSGVGAP